jgi:hypothetical protein
MSALDDAIAGHAAHPAMGGADPLSDSLVDQCTRPAVLPPLVPLRAGWENEPAEPPVPWLRMLAVVLLTVLVSWLTACGGGGEDCRPDIVGPVTAEQQALPLCPADGRATPPLPPCTTNPERCA